MDNGNPLAFNLAPLPPESLVAPGFTRALRAHFKRGLARALVELIERRGGTQLAIAQQMGISQPKVSRLLRGDLGGLSEATLLACLSRLGAGIGIEVVDGAVDAGLPYPEIARSSPPHTEPL